MAPADPRPPTGITPTPKGHDMTRPAPVADFQAAADVLREAAFRPGATTVTLPAAVVNAFANWLDDAGNDAEELGAPDPVALIAAMQVLYPTRNLSGWHPVEGDGR